MSLGLILLIVLILLLVGIFPRWGYSRSWGYGPSGGLGLVLVIILILVLLGRIEGSWIQGDCGTHFLGFLEGEVVFFLTRDVYPAKMKEHKVHRLVKGRW